MSVHGVWGFISSYPLRPSGPYKSLVITGDDGNQKSSVSPHLIFGRDTKGENK